MESTFEKIVNKKKFNFNKEFKRYFLLIYQMKIKKLLIQKIKDQNFII